MTTIQKLQVYYAYRVAQFIALEFAELSFLEDDQDDMWENLFLYAEKRYDAQELFNSLDEEELIIALNNKVPMFIVETIYE
jgi:hypothetical protein